MAPQEGDTCICKFRPTEFQHMIQSKLLDAGHLITTLRNSNTYLFYRIDICKSVRDGPRYQIHVAGPDP